MTKRTGISSVVAALSLAACAAGAPAPRTATAPQNAATRPPNLIVILADDLGYGDVCAYGCHGTKTPNIDALAASGVRFTQGYVTAPVCSPSRAGLMTGRYQQRFGHVFNAGGTVRAVKEGLGTPVDERMLPQYLKDQGYRTGMVGKWHLGPTPEKHPLSRGFEEFFGFLSGGNLYLDPLQQPGVHFVERGPEEGGSSPHRNPVDPIMRGRDAVDEKEYLTEAFTREAVSFIDRHQKEPFFLYVAYNAPHTPLQVTDKYYDRFPDIKEEGHRVFAAMLSALDDGVGAITAKVDQVGLRENTLIVFASDNGCATYTESCYNDPLLGGKLTPFEGGFRVPFMASWKGTIKPGRTSAAVVSTLDLLPTALELSGSKTAPPKPIDGESLLPILRGERDATRREDLVWRIGEHYVVRHGDWKLIHFAEHPPLLYDLKKDPGEHTDLAAKNADQVAKLEAIYQAWDKQTVPPLWTTRGDVWMSLEDLLSGKPLNLNGKQAPGLIRLPV